jgi:GMP synthase-like glutamine amidotransferase
MSVNDDLPYLRCEMDLIARALDRGTPVLGICLGAQLIAKACGAAVRRNPQNEIGWFDIHLTDAAAADPLFRRCNRAETVFHWHGETFDLPPGATLLATSDRCRNQAFRLGRATYGLQFHLEATPEMIADWCTQDENCADVRELDSPLDPMAHRGLLAALSESILGTWCDLVAQVPGLR